MKNKNKNKNKNKKTLKPTKRTIKKKSAKLVDWPSSLRTWSGSGQRKQCQDDLQSGSCQGESKTNLVGHSSWFWTCSPNTRWPVPRRTNTSRTVPTKEEVYGPFLIFNLADHRVSLSTDRGKHIHSSLIFILT